MSERLNSEPNGRRYRLISADSHVNEPPDLWTARVPAAMRDRAPRIEHFGEGDAWVIEGVKDPINFGMNACAGLAPEEMRGWCRFEDIRHGGYDPAARLAEMDADASTPRCSIRRRDCRRRSSPTPMSSTTSRWCGPTTTGSPSSSSYAPERFGGVGDAAQRGVEAALAEIDRVLDRRGMRGVVMGRYPNGTLEIKPEDDKVFGALAERGMPLDDPRELAAGDAGCASGQAAGVRPLLRRAEPHDRAGLLGRVRPLPDAQRVLRRGRFRLVAVRQGADRQQLSAPRSVEPVRSADAAERVHRKALPLRLHDRHLRHPATATTSAPNASCGRTTTRTSAPTGRTRGAPSRQHFRACRPPNGNSILAGNAQRLFGFA